MWIFKYLVCLIKNHAFIGSGYKYCVRCGKLDFEHDFLPVHVHSRD
jgi:hypothetical protein